MSSISPVGPSTYQPKLTAPARPAAQPAPATTTSDADKDGDTDGKGLDIKG